MLVTKRDGRIEEFNVQKIKDIVSFAVNGLGVSSVELESNLQTKFKNKIKTSDIQAELVNTAVSLTSVEDPDWALVAGRLEMYSLLRDIYKNTKYDYNSSLYEIITKMEKENYYDSIILKEYTKEEIDKISEFIDPSRDWILPISSVKSLRKKYLISSKKSIIELPQVANIVTCMFLNINEPKGVRIKRVEEDYNAVSLLKISLATPFKANLRKPKANLSSCFILEMDDNSESITKALGDIALISKNGGGVGIYLGRIRPSNSYIRNYPGANKINAWTKIINDVIVSFNQCHKKGSKVLRVRDDAEEVNIEDIKEGDFLLSYDTKEKTLVPKKVLKTFEKDVSDQLEIVLYNGEKVFTSKTTELFSVLEDDFKYASEFKVGDFLLSTIGFEEIIEIKESSYDEKYYDFTIEDTHNFFVNGILSHNCGIRSGAATVSLDVWHKDILDFIEMRTENGGDVRYKCFDIFPQVVLYKKFFDELASDGEFPLLDRKTIMEELKVDPVNLQEFNDNYDLIKEKVKEGKLYNCSLIKAKDLWKRILSVYIETRSLYLMHKDNVNRTNPFVESGKFINGINLCTESFSITKPSKDFDIKYNPETEKVDVTFTPGRYHTCNLISLNVSEMSIKEIEKYSRQAVRMLDNAIDLTKVPVIEGDLNSKETRVIGVGLLGVADYMARNKLDYIKNPEEVERVFECVSYNTLKSSIELAKEKGSFPLFEESCFKNGIFLGKTGDELSKESLNQYDWNSLLENAKQGVRNAMLMAIAPNTSTSLLCGSSASYLPVFNKFNYETLADMNVPVVPKYLKDRFWYYKESINIPVKDIINLTNQVTKWVDTGISCELTITPQKDNIKDLSNALIQCFNENLKTLYYNRTIDLEAGTKDGHSYCVSCAN